jgi:putative addiction module antidote
MASLRVTSVGNSLGIILPKELAVRLRLARGDQLHVVETPRGVELTPYDPALEKELKAGRSVMRRYRSALRKLAR